jgi:hypothetical protein
MAQRDVTRWEYRRRTATARNEMTVLREMGEDGWELCGVWLFFLYFKRPLPSAAH